MTHHNNSALLGSDLDAFLFAEVGTERNGMALTIVSVIARVGEDPWDEARRLSTLPTAAAIDYLAQVIARMPTGPWTLADAMAIAMRLVPLLPARSSVSRPNTGSPGTGPSMPPWARMPLLYGALGAWLVLNMIAFHGRSAADKGPAEQVGTHELQSSGLRSSMIPAKSPGASLKSVSVEAADRR